MLQCTCELSPHTLYRLCNPERHDEMAMAPEIKKDACTQQVIPKWINNGSMETMEHVKDEPRQAKETTEVTVQTTILTSSWEGSSRYMASKGCTSSGYQIFEQLQEYRAW